MYTQAVLELNTVFNSLLNYDACLCGTGLLLIKLSLLKIQSVIVPLPLTSSKLCSLLTDLTQT